MIFYQILSSYSLWKCIAISLENLYVDTGAQKVKKILHEEELHLLVSFSFEAQFEVHQNNPEQVFEGDRHLCSICSNPAMAHS